MTKRQKILLVVVCLLLLCVVAFIFSNSMEEGVDSNARSLRWGEMLRAILNRNGWLTEEQYSKFIRKLAHFTEFFALGAVSATFVCFFLVRKNRRISALPFFFTLLVADTDEFIQYFHTRTSLIKDVYIDFAGSILGIFCVYIIYWILLARKTKRKNAMLTGVHHIAILSSDREKALAFYRDALGFVLLKSYPRPERNDEILMLEGYGITLELFISKNNPLRVTRPEAYGLRHLAFAVDDVEKTVAMLTAHGYTPESLRTDTFNHKKMTFVQDPDGLPIELHE